MHIGGHILHRPLVIGVVCVTAFCAIADETVVLGDTALPPTIVADADLHESLASALADLRRCLGLICGRELKPVLAERVRKADRTILITRRKVTDDGVTADEMAKLGPEAAIIRTTTTGVVLAARTVDGARHAIYELLHRLGCRWFFPGALWEDVPNRQVLTLPVTNDSIQPSFASRRIWYGFGTGSVPKTKEDYHNWCRRNHQGTSMRGGVGHAYANTIDPDKDFAEHPEWFPLIDGKRQAKGQLCLSNTEVQERGIAYARSHFHRYPAKTLVSVSPNDGGGYCQCDSCAAMGSVSDQTLQFANIIARAIHEEFPDRYLGMYAYAGNSAPPTIKGHPNVVIYIATSFIRSGHSIEELIDGWSRQVSRLGIRDYYDVLIWNRDMPRWQIDEMRKRIPYYHSRNVIGISAEASNNWAPQGLNYYIGARLMWDHGTDVDATLSEFFHRCWGPAEAPMRRYYGRWKGNVKMSTRLLALSLLDLQEAAELATGNPIVRQRVDMFRLYLHWVCLYLEHNNAQGSQAVHKTARQAMHLAWRLGPTSMVHSYGQFRERRMWRLRKGFPAYEIERWKTTDAPPTKAAAPTDQQLSDLMDIETDATVLHLDEPAAETRAPKPFFTHAEINALTKAHIAALPSPIDISEMPFPATLVPAPLAGVTAEPLTAEHRPAYRGSNTFAFYAATAEKIEFNVTVARKGRRPVNWQITQLPIGKEVLATGELSATGGQPLTFDAPAVGVYYLKIDAGGGAVRVDFDSTPGCLLASRQHPAHLFGGGRRLYFFVPSGTTSIAAALSSPDGHARVIIHGPNGSELLDRRGNFATGEEFAIIVPEGMDGRIWSLSITKCEDATNLCLVGVPPLLAQRPELLLLPPSAK